MTKGDRSASNANAHLEEIRELEDKLVDLRRRFLEQASIELEQFIGENEAIPFLMAMAKGRRFAIPVAIVEEVVEMVETTPLLETRHGLLGVFNYHGKLVPLFDLAEIAQLGKSVVTSDNAIVICEMSERFIGVMVAEATDVFMVEKSDIEIAEEVLPGSYREIGVVKLPDGTAGIMDLWPSVMGIDPDALQTEVLSNEELKHISEQDDA